MPVNNDRLRDRFRGCLIGQAVGDALGGLFEAQSAESIRARFATTAELIDYPREELWYTDDTQMMIGVAETLIGHGEIIEERLCEAFVANYVPSRGYGRGTRAVIEAMEEGRDYLQVSERYFRGGSFGNGAAMRVAPVGLYFCDDPARLWEEANRSALPTHRHPLGIEGAQLLALAIAHAIRSEVFKRDLYFAELLSKCKSADFRAKLEQAAAVRDPNDLAGLGNGIEALYSVVTAIASFALTPGSYEETIGQVILLGGDTDTMAAMAGAISGSYLGIGRLPQRLVALLERGPQGHDYIVSLADDLVTCSTARRTVAPDTAAPLPRTQ